MFDIQVDALNIEGYTCTDHLGNSVLFPPQWWGFNIMMCDAKKFHYNTLSKLDSTSFYVGEKEKGGSSLTTVKSYGRELGRTE